jgi:hypothetical protein
MSQIGFVDRHIASFFVDDVLFSGATTFTPRQFKAIIHYSSSIAGSSMVVYAVIAALDVAYYASQNPDLLAPVASELIIPPAFIVDADSPDYTAAITFLLTARSVLAIVGPANDTSSLALIQRQSELNVAIPLLTYAGGDALFNRTLFPYYLPISFAMEYGVRFLISALRFYGQNRIAVVYCDDQLYSGDLSDSLPSLRAFNSFQEQTMQFGVYPHIIHSMPWQPTIDDFTNIILQWQAQNLTTVLLLLPRLADYEPFALASYNLGFYGTSNLVFCLTYNSYFTNFDAGTIMATVSSTWFIAAYRKHYTTVPAYNLMVATLALPRFYNDSSLTEVPFEVMFAFDAALVLIQVMYQSQKNATLNLFNASVLIEAIRGTDFTQNDDGHLLTLLASGGIAWDPEFNTRFGADGTGDYMQMLAPFPTRTRFGTSVNNFDFLPQLNPPNFPDFIPASVCCTAAM